MTMHVDHHLTYDELIRNLVDRADLGSEQQAHLQECRQCRHEAATIERRFNRLGQMARELVPAPAHAFRVPAAGSARGRWLSRPVLAMGMAGVLILVFTIFWPRVFDPYQSLPEMSAGSVVAENRLMDQIDALVDDAMPKHYQRLLAESEPLWTEEMIDWIVPSIDEDDGAQKPQA